MSTAKSLEERLQAMRAMMQDMKKDPARQAGGTVKPTAPPKAPVRPSTAAPRPGAPSAAARPAAPSGVRPTATRFQAAKSSLSSTPSTAAKRPDAAAALSSLAKAARRTSTGPAATGSLASRGAAATSQETTADGRPVIKPLSNAPTDVLIAEIQNKSGIKVTPQLKNKIDKIAAKMPPAVLGGWVEELKRLPSDHAEWMSLIEMLTVHETYFFRDPGQLEFLRGEILPQLIDENQAAGRLQLNLWSAACSTGEEAYTLAMLAVDVLLEKGLASETAAGVKVNPRWRVSVYGTDIARPAIARAKAATYQDFGLGSFRGMPDRFKRFFTEVADTTGLGAAGARSLEVRQDIRSLVSFGQFNLMDERPPKTDYDVVLCRNVMIYFDGDGKRHVQRILHKSLRDKGCMVLGPTDVLDEPNLFKPKWGGATILYEKR